MSSMSRVRNSGNVQWGSSYAPPLWLVPSPRYLPITFFVVCILSMHLPGHSSLGTPALVEIDISIYFSMVYGELRVALWIGSKPGMPKFVTLYATTCHSLTPIRRSLGSQDKNRKPIRRTDGFPLVQIRTG